jgi:hypothetical protein
MRMIVTVRKKTTIIKRGGLSSNEEVEEEELERKGIYKSEKKHALK